MGALQSSNSMSFDSMQQELLATAAAEVSVHLARAAAASSRRPERAAHASARRIARTLVGVWKGGTRIGTVDCTHTGDGVPWPV